MTKSNLLFDRFHARPSGSARDAVSPPFTTASAQCALPDLGVGYQWDSMYVSCAIIRSYTAAVRYCTCVVEYMAVPDQMAFWCLAVPFWKTWSALARTYLVGIYNRLLCLIKVPDIRLNDAKLKQRNIPILAHELQPSSSRTYHNYIHIWNYGTKTTRQTRKTALDGQTGCGC